MEKTRVRKQETKRNKLWWGGLALVTFFVFSVLSVSATAFVDKRDEVNTYLTFPEWYIVYSTQEYANFLSTNPPSKFPYLQATKQYWQSYQAVYRATKDKYGFHVADHLVLGVIGTSFSVENILKGIYENTTGRIAELLSLGQKTDEERYAQQVAQDYGVFLHTRAWYEFPFQEKLNGLWKEVPILGPSFIRKLERRQVLTVEYASKTMYGWLIRKATESTYSPAALRIPLRITASAASKKLIQQGSQIIIEESNAKNIKISVPRYDAFTDIVIMLSSGGAHIESVAENTNILVSYIVPNEWKDTVHTGSLVLEQTIPTDKNFKRVVEIVPVAEIPSLVKELQKTEVQIEHIYDY